MWAVAQTCWFVSNKLLEFIVTYPIVTSGLFSPLPHSFIFFPLDCVFVGLVAASCFSRSSFVRVARALVLFFLTAMRTIRFKCKLQQVPDWWQVCGDFWSITKSLAKITCSGCCLPVSAKSPHRSSQLSRKLCHCKGWSFVAIHIHCRMKLSFLLYFLSFLLSFDFVCFVLCIFIAFSLFCKIFNRVSHEILDVPKTF